MFLRRASTVVLLMATACTSPTAPRPELSSFVTGSPGSAGALAAATSPPTARASRGRIEVLGLMDTPTPCQALSGEFTRTGQRLSLSVAARSIGEVCILILGRFAYSAAITGLAAGEYTLEVTHTYPSTGWPTSVVLTQSITVE